MAKFLNRIKAQMQERETAQTILGSDPSTRPIIAYAEDDYSWNQLGPYLSAVLEGSDIHIVYVTSDPLDPLLADCPDGMTVHLIRDSISSFLPKVDSPVFVTTMPDLDSFHVKRSTKTLNTYIFHSLNSISMAYRQGAFDAYDVFFCTGDHHKQELEKHFASTGKTGFELREIGYPKLDRIVSTFANRSETTHDVPTVLIAPTWGSDNLLAVAGSDLVASFADNEYEVVVRPHPAFFESIYPAGIRIVSDLQERFSGYENVTIERSITSETSFLEADLMVSDWSGAAFEYTLGTERPVLFVDVPPKVKNARWADLGIEPFEARMRSEIGTIVRHGDGRPILAAADSLLSSRREYRTRLRHIREAAIYNPGTSAGAGARALVELVDRRTATG